jgi:DNA-binding transcriptional MerR regulator
MTTAVGPRDAARLTGVSTDTLRHYERLGLLPAVARTRGGYRRYPEHVLERVRLIQRALVLGFSLKELKRILSVRDAGGAPCQNVRALLGDRLASLRTRIEELIILRDDLDTLLGDWDAKLSRTAKGQQAHLLDSLGGHPRLKETRPRKLKTS